MIRLYVASEKLVKEEKDICVRLVLPVEEMKSGLLFRRQKWNH